MSMTEDERFGTKEVILRQTVSGNQLPTAATFMPQYLNLHGTTEEKTYTTSIPSLSKEDSNSEPSKCFIDVSLISSDGETFLCNKLYLAR